MKLPKPEILFAGLFVIGEGSWTYFSYEYGTPEIIKKGDWHFEEYLEYGIVAVLAVLIYIVVRSYRLKQEKSSTEYHDLFEASPIPMWIVDADTKKFLLVNESMVQKYGYTREELKAMTTYDIRPPEEAERLNEYLKQIQLGLQDTGVWIHRKKNGEQFYVQTRTNRYKYKGRESIVVLADDITDLVEKEREISRLSLVAEHTNNGIIITGADRKIEWVNPAFMEMTGYSLAEVAGKVPTEFLHGEETSKEVEQQMSTSIKNGLSFSGEVLNYKKDGSKMWVQTTISPLASDGSNDKYVAIFLDITERKRHEEMIYLQNEKLKDIAFASSHLIRAPLANILGLVNLLPSEDKTMEADVVKYLKASAEKLDEIIKEMVGQSATFEE